MLDAIAEPRSTLTVCGHHVIHAHANLWHAILLYTSGELTRRALDRHGIHDYRPIILQMYDRGFRGFRESLEKHWQAYLDGKESREAAIGRS